MMAFGHQLLTQLLPGHCPLCRQPTRSKYGYCRACLHALPRNEAACHCCALPLTIPPGAPSVHCMNCQRHLRFDRAIAPLCYAGDVPALIHAFKYRAHRPAAELLATLLDEAVAHEDSNSCALLLAPQHPRRACQRGFDHIEWLAELCPATRKLARVRARRQWDTPPLRRLNRRQRQKLMRGAFVVEENITDRSLILLDDVMTTGATLGSLARICRQLGARRITAWVIARTPDAIW